MPKPQLKWIVTANLTAEGAPAYLTAAGEWSRLVSDAAVFESKDDAEARRKQALVQESRVADPYLMEASDAGPALDLLTARERIRSAGPTVPYGRDVQPVIPANYAQHANKVQPVQKPFKV